MTDLASAAAAVSAGYTKTQSDRGAGTSPRFLTTFEKQLGGNTGQAHANSRAIGTSDVSAAAADTAALNSLNGQRNIRFGTGATAGTDTSGKTKTFDGD